LVGGVLGVALTYLARQVFPKHVVDKLKAGLKPEIENKAEVSVLFTDIVGFTTLSSTLTAEQVSDMLDRFFSQLDAVIQELDLYKVSKLPCAWGSCACIHRPRPFGAAGLPQVDVIGDCVIVAGNLYKRQADHISRLCRFALRALHAAEITAILPGSEMGSVRIRCGYVAANSALWVRVWVWVWVWVWVDVIFSVFGRAASRIHVGPVVCNLVGSLSPKYTLLGDTMKYWHGAGVGLSRQARAPDRFSLAFAAWPAGWSPLPPLATFSYQQRLPTCSVLRTASWPCGCGGAGVWSRCPCCDDPICSAQCTEAMPGLCAGMS
jgi:class 3 adenylate cyclase